MFLIQDAECPNILSKKEGETFIMVTVKVEGARMLPEPYFFDIKYSPETIKIVPRKRRGCQVRSIGISPVVYKDTTEDLYITINGIDSIELSLYPINKITYVELVNNHGELEILEMYSFDTFEELKSIFTTSYLVKKLEEVL